MKLVETYRGVVYPWVYNPDVMLEVTADYKSQVDECDETNNTKVFKGIG